MNNSKDQKTDNKTDKLKCPLNNFQACIGDECTFSFHSWTLEIPSEGDNEPAKGRLSSLIPGHPCAIVITGMSSAFNLLNFDLFPKND